MRVAYLDCEARRGNWLVAEKDRVADTSHAADGQTMLGLTPATAVPALQENGAGAKES